MAVAVAPRYLVERLRLCSKGRWEGNMQTADLTVAPSFGINVQQVASGKGNNPVTRPPIPTLICVPLHCVLYNPTKLKAYEICLTNNSA